MKQRKQTRCNGILALLIFGLFLCGSVNLLSAAEPKKATPQKTPAQVKSAMPKYGGVLKVADMSTGGTSIGYPVTIARSPDNRQGGTAIETLLRYDKMGKVVPWLATGYKEDPKTKAIILTIRKGVRFHDGTDFNADAVKWNLEQHIAAKVAGAKSFASIDVVDNYSVRINLTQWDSTALTNLANTVGMIISPTACKKNGPEWAARHPVGTGPFEFVSWEKDVRITFKKFSSYWQKGKPYLDGIEWIAMDDSLTREFSFRKGDLDVAVVLDQQNIKKLEKEGYVNKRQGMSGATTLVPDSANPNSPWSKLKVRQAAQYAINTEDIANTVFSGEVQPGKQWVYKGHWGYNPAVVGYPYNPAKAKQLLKEAGYPDGFKTKIIFMKGYNELGVIAVQGYLKAVGIDAELDASLPARLNQVSMGGAKWEGLVFGTASGEPDVLSVMATRISGLAGWYTELDYPADFVKAIQNGIIAPDFKTKQQRVWEVQKLMVDKYCMLIMLWCSLLPVTEQPYVKNSGFFEVINVGLWTPEDVWLAK